ncbi:MAG: sigma-70 family RNA polymerase sigma factor [Clostridia bacterium]|nr:sigma-70 family RNA polymerase sigma factor [Clostridia bacterium]
METVKGPDSSQEKWLIQIIDQYQASLLQICFMYLHDRTMAEDAVQETFLKAYKSMAAFRGECSEKTWLTRIAINTCRDMKRSAWFRHIDRRLTPDDLPPLSVQPADHSDAQELALAIVKLPAKYKEVILLYYYQDMTMREIAQALGIAVSSVYGRLKQACEKLRKVLEKEDGDGR